MSITVDLPPQLEAQVREQAAQKGQAPSEYIAALVQSHIAPENDAATIAPAPKEIEGANEDYDPTHLDRLIEAVRLTPERIAERQARFLATVKPRNPPTDGTNGMHRVFGAWPGDETEEELLRLERRLDDEDAGRA